MFGEKTNLVRVRSHRFVCRLWACRPLRSRRTARPRRSLSLPPMRRSRSSMRRKELAGFLGQITGATFELAGQEKPEASCLFVGPAAAKQADKQFSTEGLGAEGIVIKTVGDDLILAGGPPRGTLYAVYTFLEDQLGCRWWSSTESTIPKKPTISVDEINIKYVPPLEYRSAFWFDAFDGDWAVRNKCNGQSHRLDAKQGGRHIYEGFVHTFYPLIPPEKYFAEHPEWFSEIKGKRTTEHAQLCLTNEDMRKGTGQEPQGAAAEQPGGHHRLGLAERLARQLPVQELCRHREGRRQPRRSDAAVRQRRGGRYRAGVPERRHQHPGLPVHAQAPRRHEAAAQRHRPVVQHRVLLLQAAGGRAQQGVPRRHHRLVEDLATGSTSGTTRPTSGTTSCRTRTCGSWARM